MDGPQLVAVYGTLRRGGRNHHLLARGGARAAGLAHLGGTLVVVQGDRYTYPGYLPGDDGRRVEVELYRVAPAVVTGPLDTLEGYDPLDEAGSHYLRRLLPVLGPGTARAWTYVYNRPTEGLPVVPDGVWRQP